MDYYVVWKCMQWLKIWLIRFSFLRILLLISLSRNLMMSWSPCFAARSSCPSAEAPCSLRDFDFNNFILTLAQSSLTAARLPEMQARWRGEEPKLEDIVKDTSEGQLSMMTSGGQSLSRWESASGEGNPCKYQVWRPEKEPAECRLISCVVL